MTKQAAIFNVIKYVLDNGLTILVRPSHSIPRVETHLWYNVGSKDENNGELGMAHLLEHMMFKGTNRLSESDINLVCQKLAGDANAFTSQDYTCYTFRLPRSSWHTSLEILAECMQTATFRPQMLASEVKAVIEEMRMYREDYQGALIEQTISAVFPEHPYHRPIIGLKHDLCAINQEKLLAFYKKHYHPGNAVLVVTGDVEADDVHTLAKKYFGHIPARKEYKKESFYVADDLISTTTVLKRPTSNPWYTYLYKIPGMKEAKNHILDVANIILATGKSSRLYQRLVNKDRIALDIDCSVYDLFDRGLMCINIWPAQDISPAVIEQALYEELALLGTEACQTWEFEAAKKRTQTDLVSLIESSEKQAFVIGNSYLATGNVHFVDEYLKNIDATTKADVQEFFAAYFDPATVHKGYLIPTNEKEVAKLLALQNESDAVERSILEVHVRTSPVEDGVWVNTLPQQQPLAFTYPKPIVTNLDNGIELVYHHNTVVPNVVCLLSFKANHYYEPEHQAGILGFLLRVMTESIKGHTDQSFAQMLESAGIYIGAGSDTMAIRCLHGDFKKALSILGEILTKPSFDNAIIEKVRNQIINDLDELWDSPIDFVDQLAKEAVYKDHHYSKNALGNHESIKNISVADLKTWYEQYITPLQTTMVIVGDLSAYDVEETVTSTLKQWRGQLIHDLDFTAIQPLPQQKFQVRLDRDQAVLGFIAPSISRKDPDFNALALLDMIVCGGANASPSSRLFQLREKTGLFYVIGGSLIYGAHEQPGMVFLKTTVATEKVDLAQKLILEALDTVQQHGVTHDELERAKNLLLASSVELFESNAQMAQTFLFLKKLHLSFNLFDKQAEMLSILTIEQVNNLAKRFCNRDTLSSLVIGKIEDLKNVSSQKRRVR